MKEDKYLDDLFEQAKNEPPQLSFEEVATRFESSVATTGSLAILKEWVLNHLNLNSFIMITITSSILTALYLIFTPTNPSFEAANNISEITPTEITTIDKRKPTNSTIAPVQEAITQSETSEAIKKRETQNPITPLTKKEKLAIDISPRNNSFNIPELAKKVEADTLPKLLSSRRQIEVRPMEPAEPMEVIEPMKPAEPMEVTEPREPRKPKKPKKPMKPNTSPSINTEEVKQTNSGYGFTIDTDERKWQEQTKTFQKEFDLGPNGVTKIINQFGKIHVLPWDQNKAKIEAVVTISANKQEKIVRVLENVTIDFSQKDQFIKAETVVTNRKEIHWNTRINWKISIDYKVFIPQTSTIDINHYHGEVLIDEFHGNTKLRINHTDFFAENIGKEARIIMGHGKGVIKNGGNILADLLHSEIKAGVLGAVELDLGHSTIEAKKTGDISGKSLFGKIRFDTIGNYKVKGTGGNILIGKAQKVDLKQKHGEIFISNAKDITAELEHAKFRSIALGNVELAIKNSRFSTQKAGHIKGNSTQGEISLGIIDSYENTSHGTKVEIEQVNTVKTKGHKTKLTINEVVKDLAVDFEFGRCKATLKSLNPQITLSGKNAHFKLKIPTNAQYKFDMTSNTKNYSFPKDIQLNRSIEKVTHHEAAGFSKDSTAQNLMKVDLLWGRFELEKNNLKE